MLTKTAIRQPSLSLSITFPCSVKVSPPINLQKETGANSIKPDCRTTLLTDSSPLPQCSDWKAVDRNISCAYSLYRLHPVGPSDTFRTRTLSHRLAQKDTMRRQLILQCEWKKKERWSGFLSVLEFYTGIDFSSELNWIFNSKSLNSSSAACLITLQRAVPFNRWWFLTANRSISDRLIKQMLHFATQMYVCA